MLSVVNSSRGRDFSTSRLQEEYVKPFVSAIIADKIIDKAISRAVIRNFINKVDAKRPTFSVAKSVNTLKAVILFGLMECDKGEAKSEEHHWEHSTEPVNNIPDFTIAVPNF